MNLHPTNEASRWAIVRALFESAISMTGEHRKNFLDFACSDTSLRAEVEGLLEADASAEVMIIPADQIMIEVKGEPVLPVISGYRVDSEIGVGGAGSVWLAVNSETGRRVAIKIIYSLRGDSQAIQRFRQECRALARLSHAGIVQLLETGTVNSFTYSVMEFVDGVTVDQWIKKNQPSPARCIILIQEILSALAHAHDAGVIHRDIKPHNVLVTQSGQAKIVDFGISSLTNKVGLRTGFRTETGHLVGTFAYMSPEQADGDSKKIRAVSDVYQTALMLFEMLSGRFPYTTEDKNVAGLLKAILLDERVHLANLRPDLDSDLCNLLQQALSIDPSMRPQSARELNSALDVILGNMSKV